MNFIILIYNNKEFILIYITDLLDLYIRTTDKD